MKTFIYHDPRDSKKRNRVEIKTPTVQTLGEKPEMEFEQVALYPQMPMVDWRQDFSRQDEKVNYYAMVFETVRFSTMKWIEERIEHGNSLGYYARVDSYCRIPEGANIEGAMKYEQGTDIYGYLNTVPLHGRSEHMMREKIRDMEVRLRELSTRPILPEETLRQMRENWLDTRDHSDSIPQRLKEYDYFDNDNDFRVE